MPSNDPTDFDWMLRALKAIAEEKRLKLLGILADRECSVEELAALVGLKAPTVSHHLARLREAQLVQMRCDGNAHLYRMDSAGLKLIRGSLGSSARVAQLAGDLPSDLDGWEHKVLRSFVSGEELVRIPASRKKRDVVLRWLVEFFEPEVEYEEREINAELKRHHWDCATLRREFIASKLMARSSGIYRRLPLPETPAEPRTRSRPVSETPAGRN